MWQRQVVGTEARLGQTCAREGTARSCAKRGHRARQRKDADGGYDNEMEGEGGGPSERLTAELVEGSVKPGEVEAVRRGGDVDDGSGRRRLASGRRARRPARRATGSGHWRCGEIGSGKFPDPDRVVGGRGSERERERGDRGNGVWARVWWGRPK